MELINTHISSEIATIFSPLFWRLKKKIPQSRNKANGKSRSQCVSESRLGSSELKPKTRAWAVGCAAPPAGACLDRPLPLSGSPSWSVLLLSSPEQPRPGVPPATTLPFSPRDWYTTVDNYWPTSAPSLTIHSPPPPPAPRLQVFSKVRLLSAFLCEASLRTRRPARVQDQACLGISALSSSSCSTFMLNPQYFNAHDLQWFLNLGFLNIRVKRGRAGAWWSGFVTLTLLRRSARVSHV